LVYGSFTYTKETHEAKIGPLEMAVKERETVNVPVWAGVGQLSSAADCCSRAARGLSCFEAASAASVRGAASSIIPARTSPGIQSSS